MADSIGIMWLFGLSSETIIHLVIIACCCCCYTCNYRFDLFGVGVSVWCVCMLAVGFAEGGFIMHVFVRVFVWVCLFPARAWRLDFS